MSDAPANEIQIAYKLGAEADVDWRTARDWRAGKRGTRPRVAARLSMASTRLGIAPPANDPTPPQAA